jgi:hypothetical protein
MAKPIYRGSMMKIKSALFALAFSFLAVGESFGGNVVVTGLKITKIQLQKSALINGGTIPGSHHVCRVISENGSGVVSEGWFELDDAQGFGKGLLTLFLSAQASGLPMTVSFSDENGAFKFVQGMPDTYQVTQYIWSASSSN